jgi:Fur family ferric uptake transcriptional regulator
MILMNGVSVACCDRKSSGTGTAFGPGRSTEQRRAIASAVAELGGAFTAEDLAAHMRANRGGVSTATLYRSIATMAGSGFIAPVGERDGAVLYVGCASPDHHHHLVCTSCGATAQTPCPVDAAELARSAPDGFVVTSHEVRLYGLCAKCAAASGS